MLFLLACVELPSEADKPAGPVGTDTGARDTAVDDTADTGTPPDTDTGTDMDTGETVCEEEWPDQAVATDAACPDLPPVDWEIVESWRYDQVGLFGAGAQAARYEDSDGDALTTPADAMGLWLTPHVPWTTGSAAVYLDGAGSEIRVDTGVTEDQRIVARAADLDPGRVGMEDGMYRALEGDRDLWTVADESGGYLDSRADDGGQPWYTDLEGDGVPELLLGATVRDALDGRIIERLPQAPGTWHLVSADLDRDGVVEIVGEAYDGVGIWRVGAGDPTVCPAGVPDSEQQFTTLAIADLDADDDAEIVRADDYVLSLCDADGTLLAERESPSAGGGILGVGELDGDPEPEIVLDYNGLDADGALVAGIVVYDHTLAELWRWPTAEISWNPFHLADLDGDGRHEIVVREAFALTILDGAGAVLATHEAGYHNNHWKNTPLVVDLDGDGLAEIVTTGQEPAIQVWENGVGGWLVDDAGVSTSGIGHHPGILAVDGTVPPESAWWLASNVWQGHPASGTPQLADLRVRVESVCAETCDEDLYVTVYVENTGVADVEAPVAVRVERADGLTLFETRVEPPLRAGVSKAVPMRVSPADARVGLVFTADAGGIVRECDESNNAATWAETPCP